VITTAPGINRWTCNLSMMSTRGRGGRPDPFMHFGGWAASRAQPGLVSSGGVLGPELQDVAATGGLMSLKGRVRDGFVWTVIANLTVNDDVGVV